MRRVKLWVEGPGHLAPVLVLERVCEDNERVDFPLGVVLLPGESHWWESEPIVPPVEDFTVRRAVLQAIGHASVCWDREGVFDEREAISVANDLIATLGLDENAVVHDLDDVAPMPPAPEVVPDWFIAWRASQYNADLLDIVDRLDSLKASVVDKLTRAHSRMAEMEETLRRFGNRFKVRKSVLARERAIREEDERYDD